MSESDDPYDGRPDAYDIGGKMIHGLRYTSLKRFIFVDNEDLEVGSIEDLVLDPETLLPTHLVLGAGFFEEYMEIMGKRPDIDELVEVDKLEQQNDSVILIHQSIDDMIKTDETGLIPFPSILFSHLMTVNATLKSGEEVIISDYELSGGDSRLICHIQRLNDEMLKLQFRQRIELLIPLSRVKKSIDQLAISYTLDELIEITKQSVAPKLNGKSKIRIS